MTTATPPANSTGSVFISYSRADSDVVDVLERDLQSHHISTWIDRHKLEGGQTWAAEIRAAIDHSHAVVVVLSPDALASRWVRYEYEYALRQQKCIALVVYHPCDRLPKKLQSLPTFTVLAGFSFTTQYAQQLGRLLDFVEQSNASAPQRPLSTPPHKPMQRKWQLVALSSGVVLPLVIGLVVARLIFPSQLVYYVPVLRYIVTPQACFTSVADPSTGSLTIDFDATCSTGSQLRYTWDFDDDSIGSGSQVSHAYQQPGNYIVRLTVTDSINQTSLAAQTVPVSYGPPTAAFTFSVDSSLPCQVAFDASASTGWQLQYYWTFGDGSTQGPDGAETYHVYSAAGRYKVGLKAVDFFGHTDSTTMTVQLIGC